MHENYIGGTNMEHLAKHMGQIQTSVHEQHIGIVGVTWGPLTKHMRYN
jgi:hypothetical protein